MTSREQGLLAVDRIQRRRDLWRLLAGLFIAFWVVRGMGWPLFSTLISYRRTFLLAYETPDGVQIRVDREETPVPESWTEVGVAGAVFCGSVGSGLSARWVEDASLYVPIFLSDDELASARESAAKAVERYAAESEFPQYLACAALLRQGGGRIERVEAEAVLTGGLYAISGAGLLLSVPMAVMHHGRVRRARAWEAGLCVGCGYDLKGSSRGAGTDVVRCPECGCVERAPACGKDAFHPKYARSVRTELE